MAELADAHGSGPCDSNIMRVQVPFPAFAYALSKFYLQVIFRFVYEFSHKGTYLL